MSSPSGFLPAIKVIKSSIPAARRIYAAMDYLDEASKKRLHKKRKRKAVHKRARTTSPKKDAPSDPSTRSKEYSKELRVRKEKARIAKAKDEDSRKHHEQLKVKGMREKTRLNQLFAIYATQQENSYRPSAQVTRPKFPNLFKAAKDGPKGKPESTSPLPSVFLVGNKIEKE